MQNFRKIFEGNNSAYGQLILTGETTNKGKAIGKAFIKREPIPDQLWQDHLDGKDPALGVIPINEENMCRWGCIDVDEYNLDHKKLAASIKSHKFPVVMFRSKSGGAHLFLFTTEFIAASLMQAKLKMMSEALGFGGSEIFPKQTEILVERGDTGNFLNLPYHGGIRGLRYAFNNEGNAASLEAFYTIYEEWVQTPEQIQEIIVTKAAEVSNEAFKDGPPCLNKLADEGFGEGSRNNGLFNIAMYHKQASPDDWQDAVSKSNQTYFDPPLPYQEVNALINSNPPQWFLNVVGKRIELKTEQLHNPNLFAIAVLDQANVVSPIPKAKDWREVFLKPLMLNLQQIDPLESLNANNQIENLLYDYTVHRAKARTKDDILNKTAWTDEGFCYFRMEDFYAFAKRNNWEMDKTKTYNLITQLKDIFVGEIRMQLKNQTPRVVKINSMKDNGAEVSQVPYQESPF